jgi:uncharacterized protein (TIGR02611 family)
MLERLTKQWRYMMRARPGHRFQARHEHRRRQHASPLWKPLYLTLGTALFLLGLVLLVFPGPGFLVIFIGGAMIAEESLWVARSFDALEVKLRKLGGRGRAAWKRASAVVKTAIVAAGAGFAAVAGWCAYAILIA